MKNIKVFEDFINESSIDLRNIIDILSNSMEHTDETEFADLMTDYGWDQDKSFEIFNSYWDLGAKDRMKWGTKEWTVWLKKHGIKESLKIEESVEVKVSIRHAREAGDLFDDMFKSYGKKTASDVFTFKGKDSDDAAYDFVNMLLKHTQIPKDEIESDDKEIKKLLEGIDENLNDPVLVAMRAAKEDRKKKVEAQKERMKKRVYGKQREKLEDELWSISQDLKDAYAERRNIYNDMEAEAGEKGDAWSDDDANRYGSRLNLVDDEIENLIKRRQTIEVKLAY
jgi:hypothetical protein